MVSKIDCDLYAAARHGDFDTVQACLAQVVNQNVRNGIILEAAAAGHLNIIKLLHPHLNTGCQECCSASAVDWAAGSGHLHVVRWFNLYCKKRGTENAIDWAANGGHHDTVNYLFVNDYTCSTYAMDGAARHGFLSIMQLLKSNGAIKCTTRAMDLAALGGHMRELQWLYENTTVGCTWRALNFAVDNNKIEVVRWLLEHCREQCNLQMALKRAFIEKNTDIVALLQSEIDDTECGDRNNNDENVVKKDVLIEESVLANLVDEKRDEIASKIVTSTNHVVHSHIELIASLNSACEKRIAAGIALDHATRAYREAVSVNDNTVNEWKIAVENLIAHHQSVTNASV